MATSKVSVTEGSGKNLATNSFTEDAVTKELSRVVINASDGTDATPTLGQKAASGSVPVVINSDSKFLSIIGGHADNTITRSNLIADSDNAQTNVALVSVSAGTRIVLTRLTVTCAAANTVNVAVRVGFGTATIPASALAGAAAIVIEGQFGAGGGVQIGNGAGIIGAGADGEDLRITCDDPVGGNVYVSYSYYTIAA